MPDTVLIADRDGGTLKILCRIFESNGFFVNTAASGEEVLKMVKESEYVLLLLDINLYGTDGFEVIKSIRRDGLTLPVIILSESKEDYDTLYGLDIGADDYITKPFNPVTLTAKAKALIRRSNGNFSDRENTVKAGPFTYNTSTLRFFKNGVEILLTGKENAVMKLFMDNVGRTFSKDMLYDLVWGNAIVDDNTVMVYIRRLRQKIEDDPAKPKFIQNIRGIGYRFTV